MRWTRGIGNDKFIYDNQGRRIGEIYSGNDATAIVNIVNSARSLDLTRLADWIETEGGAADWEWPKDINKLQAAVKLITR